MDNNDSNSEMDNNTLFRHGPMIATKTCTTMTAAKTWTAMKVTQTSATQTWATMTTAKTWTMTAFQTWTTMIATQS